MNRVDKFLRKIDTALRQRLKKVIADIITNRLEGLDIKPLKGFDNTYRCRVGNVRIIFKKGLGINYPLDMDFRGNIYKK